MICIARIKVLSDDRPRRVDAIGHGALARACTCARSIERGDDALRVAYKTVNYVARVKVLSCNHACRVDVKGLGETAPSF